MLPRLGSSVSATSEYLQPEVCTAAPSFDSTFLLKETTWKYYHFIFIILIFIKEVIKMVVKGSISGKKNYERRTLILEMCVRKAGDKHSCPALRIALWKGLCSSLSVMP